MMKEKLISLAYPVSVMNRCRGNQPICTLDPVKQEMNYKNTIKFLSMRVTDLELAAQEFFYIGIHFIFVDFIDV